jgi:glyoxylase-like metal-dependent hydrolase (beta-lactamase superfamily II)
MRKWATGTWRIYLLAAVAMGGFGCKKRGDGSEAKAYPDSGFNEAYDDYGAAGGGGDGSEDGAALGVQWIYGGHCGPNQDPPIQVVKLDANTYILRQSKCLNYEGTFMHLLFGDDVALLLDTGAVQSAQAFPLRRTVDQIIAARKQETGTEPAELVVAHTHGHGDHVAADGQFMTRPHTRVVPLGAPAVMGFFGLNGTAPKTFELGNRPLDVFMIPGHLGDHIAVYDQTSQNLYTGDSLYPGRLYVKDWTAYRQSMKRLNQFAQGRPIKYVLGAHVEMSAESGVDYPIGTNYQPNEHPLELHKADIARLDQALDQIGAYPQRKNLGDFIIYPN